MTTPCQCPYHRNSHERKRKSQSELNRDAISDFYKNLYTRTRRTGRAAGNRPWARPLKSDSLAVHPDQILEAMESDRKLGVSTEYDPKDGRPIFRDRNHRKRYCQAYGVIDRDGGYGDAQQGKTRLSGYKEPEPDYSHLDEACDSGGVEQRTDYHNKAYFGVVK